MKKKQTTGLVLGKFIPFHRGHELLIDFAKHYVDRLFVVVDNIPAERYENEYIPGHIRVEWIKRRFSDCEIFYLPQVNPQEPHEHPDFWNIWRKTLLDLLPVKPDYFFASETYGFNLAKALESIFIPVDVGRQTVKINATKIRSNLYENWGYLTDAAKPEFIFRVCVSGPESAGKTTITRHLAKHFNTVFVPEYARFFIETKSSYAKAQNSEYQLQFKDILAIARGQTALEDSLRHQANRILFCDTDPLATTIWSKWLFDGKCDEEVYQLADKRKYDLYLLLKPDIGWKEDNVRYTPDQKERDQFFKEIEKEIKARGDNYVVIGGKDKSRKKEAIKAVEDCLKEKFTYQYFLERLQK